MFNCSLFLFHLHLQIMYTKFEDRALCVCVLCMCVWLFWVNIFYYVTGLNRRHRTWLSDGGSPAGGGGGGPSDVSGELSGAPIRQVGMPRAGLTPTNHHPLTPIAITNTLRRGHTGSKLKKLTKKIIGACRVKSQQIRLSMCRH
jgi:hypothetical protein